MSDERLGYPLVCIHDNPATWQREVWQDGTKIASAHWRLFDRADIERKALPFYLPITPFSPGQIWGNIKAMKPFSSTPSRGGWGKVKSLVALLEAADSKPKGGGE